MGQISCGTRQFTTGELQQRACQAAAGFKAMGVQSGDTVALLLRNDLPFLEASLAANLLSAFPVPINWHSTADEIRYILQDSGARLLVVHEDLLPAALEAAPASVTMIKVPTPPEILHAYLIDNVPEASPPLPVWEDWLLAFPADPLPPAGSPSSIIYTSGTTGRPKGVRRSPASAEQADVARGLMLRELGFRLFADPAQISTVVTGPMYHTAPNMHALVAVSCGANVRIMPRFDAEELLRIIEQARVTHLQLVPIMFKRLLGLTADVRDAYDLSSLRHVVHAGAPCPQQMKRDMIAWWGPIIHDYYGATETAMVVSCTSEEWLRHPGTVGKPVPEATVLILDADGRPLPAGEIGEIAARVHNVADFTYFGDQAKRDRVDRDGLIAPGDIGYLDGDGFLFLVDRANDMIISGGVNIYPAEIEAALLEHPAVADCAVFGIPDAEFGESVHAVIQPRPGECIVQADLAAWLRKRLSGFKVPRSFETCLTLPREDSGKIFKRKLKERYWASDQA